MASRRDDISVSVKVSRASEGPLELDNPAGGYEVVEQGPGARTYRRSVIEGRYVHGRTLLVSTLETRTLVMVVRVLGDNWQQVRTRAQVLIDAVSQHAYTITADIDGVVDTYVCEPADVALAGADTWSKFHIMANQHEYVLSIPYDPA